MSRGFIIGAGGENISVYAAVLHVSAPFGSTVSIAKGGVTVKSLGPGRAHTNTDGESADYYFSIAPANYGAWTVTATRGEDSTSAAVTVDSNRQYDVVLVYKVYAMKNGQILVNEYLTPNIIAKTTGDGYVQYQHTGSGTYRIINFGPFDVTSYTKLYITFAGTTVTTGYKNECGICRNVNNSDFAAKLTYETNFSGTKEVDIANCGGEYYATVLFQGSGSVPYVRLSDIWFER